MAEYRLLEVGDTIQFGDEILLDDCETWDAEFYASKESNGHWYVGHDFIPTFHVPMRRKT